MGNRRHGQPEKFGEGTWATNERPVDPLTVEGAVARFVARFVVKSKRERMQMLLLHDDRERRIQGLQTLYRWLDPQTTTELEGNAGSPHQLGKRFGEVGGILIRESSSLRVSAPHASSLAAGGFGALFLADGGQMALLFPEIGAPTLAFKA